ncbi:MAG: hypothetical protein ACKVQU_34120 [Burkholderiales bacterium]
MTPSKKNRELRPSPIAFSDDGEKELLEALGVDCGLPNVPNDEHRRWLTKVARALDGFESLVNAFDRAAQNTAPESDELEAVRSAADALLVRLKALTPEQRRRLDLYRSTLGDIFANVQDDVPLMGPATVAEVEYDVANLVALIDTAQPNISTQRGRPRKHALRILIAHLGELFERQYTGDDDLARPRRGAIESLSPKEAARQEFVEAALRIKNIAIPKRLDRYWAADDVSDPAGLDNAQWAAGDDRDI